jgi:hypothetical protein
MRPKLLGQCCREHNPCPGGPRNYVHSAQKLAPYSEPALALAPCQRSVQKSHLPNKLLYPQSKASYQKACALLPNSDNPPHPATRSTLYSLPWANLGLFPSQASCLSTASFRLTLPPLLMVVPVTSSQLSLRQILTT